MLWIRHRPGGRTQPLLQTTVSSPSSNALAWWIRNVFSVSYTCPAAHYMGAPAFHHTYMP